MIERNPDGSISTYVIEIQHTLWPCVANHRGMTCEDAQKAYKRFGKMGAQLAADRARPKSKKDHPHAIRDRPGVLSPKQH